MNSKLWSRMASASAQVALDAALEGLSRSPENWGYWWAIGAETGSSFPSVQECVLGLSWESLVQARGNTREVRPWAPPKVYQPILGEFWVKFPMRHQDYAGWWGAPDPGIDPHQGAGTDIVPVSHCRAMQVCNRLNALCGFKPGYPQYEKPLAPRNRRKIRIIPTAFEIPSIRQYENVVLSLRYDDRILDQFALRYRNNLYYLKGMQEQLMNIVPKLGILENNKYLPTEEHDYQESRYNNGAFPIVGGHILPFWTRDPGTTITPINLRGLSRSMCNVTSNRYSVLPTRFRVNSFFSNTHFSMYAMSEK